ncbi:MAG TPA: TlpA disulfide reductase family protein [Phycisphaerales bacterium]|nr:TlpA disulfide reductase family protein [Phycisphaerales bacterium]
MRSPAAMVAGVGLLLFVAGVAPTAAAPRVGALAAAATAMAADPSQMPAEMKAIIDRATERYRTVKTVSLVQRERFIVRREGVAQPDVLSEAETKLKFARGKGMRIDADRFVVFVSDGRLILRSPELNQYIEAPLSAGTYVSEVLNDLTQGSLHAPMSSNALIDAEGALKWALHRTVKFESLQAEPRGGAPGHWMAWRIKSRNGDEYVTNAWYDEARSWPMFSRLDYTKWQQEIDEQQAEMDEEGGEKAAKLVWAGYETEVTELKLDEPVDESLLVFTPGPKDRKVEEFEAPEPPSEADQMGLIGKEAPGFSSKDLSDKAVTLAEYRGKVVVMDFWATWCGPCVAALPEVWKVAQAYKDKPVVFLGMNHDRPGSTKKVASFLEKRGITIRQALDHDGRIGNDYKVSAIPTMVIVDAKGVVQDIHVGAGGDIATELTAKIEKVLRGEALHSAEELAALAKPADKEGSARSFRMPKREKLEIAEDHPERLLADKSVSKMVGSVMRPFAGNRFPIDLDLNSVPELAYADFNGRLMAISEDGLSTRRIIIEGTGQGTQYLDIKSVRDGDRALLLLAWTNEIGKGGVHLGAFASDGQPVWTHVHELPSNAMANCDLAAGDLDGDGAMDYAALIGTSIMGSRSGDSDTQKSGVCLKILDGQGSVRAVRDLDADFSGFVHIAAPGEAGKAPLILLQTGQEIRRFTYDPKGAAVEETKAR